MFTGHKLRRTTGNGGELSFNFEFLATTVQTNNTATRTFSANGLGTVHPERMIVVSITWGATASRTLNSASINGVSATIVADLSATQGGTAIVYAKVPTGTSGDYVFSFSGTTTAARIAKYAFNTTATTALDSGTASNPVTTTTLTTADIECTTGGVVIAVRFGGGSATCIGTWSGTDSVVETADAVTESDMLWHGYVLTSEDSTTNDFTTTASSSTATPTMSCASFEYTVI